MKIESLHFSNLNSLSGEWMINFCHPDIEDHGIFAIVGPTGAGKSTILDAITLALYGRTVRLKTISKSDNEILSLRTTKCFAEVCFKVGDVRYKTRWSQHRAGNKVDGALQEAKTEISRINTEGSGDILCTKKSEHEKEIAKLTGLNFERFTQSLLLAQGEFATFLKTDDKSRASSLEEITGTHIYSQMSQFVFETHREKVQELEDIKRDIQTIEGNDGDSRLDLEQRQNDLFQKNKLWQEHSKAQKTLVEALKNLIENREHKETSETKNKKNATEFSDISKVLLDKEKILSDKDKQREEAEANKVKDRERYTRWSEKYQQWNDWQERGEKALQDLELYQLDQTKLEEKESHRQQEDETLQIDLKKIQTTLAERGQGLEELSELKDRLNFQFGKLKKSYPVLQEGISDDNNEAKSFSSEDTDVQSAFYTKLKKLAESLHDGLLEEKQDLEKWETVGNTLDASKKQYAEKNKELEEKEKKIESLEKKNTELRAYYEDLKRRYELQRDILVLTEQRRHLEEGKACPLCGSFEHDLEAIAEYTFNTNDLAKQEEEFLDTEEHLRGSEKEEYLLKSAVEELKRVLDSLETEKNKNITEWKLACQKVFKQASFLQTLWKDLISFASSDLSEELKTLQTDLEVQKTWLKTKDVQSYAAWYKEEASALDLVKKKIRLWDALFEERKEAQRKQILFTQHKESFHEEYTDLQRTLKQWDDEVRNICLDEVFHFHDHENNYRALLDQEEKIASIISNFKKYEEDEKKKTNDLQEKKEELKDIASKKELIKEKVANAKVRYKEFQQSQYEIMTSFKEHFPELFLFENPSSDHFKREKEAWELRFAEREKDEQIQNDSLKREKALYEENKERQIQLETEMKSLKQELESLEKAIAKLETVVCTLPDLVLNDGVQPVRKNALNTSENNKLEDILSNWETRLDLYRNNYETSLKELGEIEAELKSKDKQDQRIHLLEKNWEDKRNKLEHWSQLNDLIGSARGDKYRTIVQSLTLNRVLYFANQQLNQMSDRYVLTQRTDESQQDKKLAIFLLDGYQAGQVRSCHNLSGGETFLVSLALALGLAQMQGSQTPIDTLFIDEGFGSLDEETLEVALQALNSLHERGKTVGVISHVHALQESIATKIEVYPDKQGRSFISGAGVSRLA